MRRYSKISGMTIVTCDHSYPVRHPGEPEVCGEEFRTCSDKSVIQKQLDAAEWTVRDEMIDGQKAKIDRCPYHSKLQRGRMTMAAERDGSSGGSRFG